MHFSTVATLALPALAQANVHNYWARQSDNSMAIINYIQQTGKDSASLSQVLSGAANNAMDLGFIPIQLLGASTSLQNDISNTTSAAMSSGQLSSSSSGMVVSAVEAILPDIFGVLNNFAAHCQAFINTKLTSAVLQNLQTQRDLVQKEGAAISSKLDSAYASTASVGVSAILSVFDSAISVFSLSSCPATLVSATPPATGGMVSATPSAASSMASATATSMASVAPYPSVSSAMSMYTPMTTAAASMTSPAVYTPAMSTPAMYTGAAAPKEVRNGLVVAGLALAAVMA